MIHKTEIEHYSLEELVEEIGNLRYDSLAHFLKLLEIKLKEDAINDLKKDRTQLGHILEQSGEDIYAAYLKINKIWEICKPHMV